MMQWPWEMRICQFGKEYNTHKNHFDVWQIQLYTLLLTLLPTMDTIYSSTFVESNSAKSAESTFYLLQHLQTVTHPNAALEIMTHS